jgi:glycosyltransferase involved in cell wall biosynthesis
VSEREAQRVGTAPRALILVRNPVTHDNRVLREVQTLRLAGFAVLVAGAVTSTEPRRRVRVGEAEVVRIEPLVRRRRGASRQRPASAAPPLPGSRVRARARLRRLAVTASYNLRGAALCRRTRPALVHANDYNTMWIALAAKLMCGSRVVYDNHELWADRNGRPEWRAWLIACETLFVRVADAVITASPGYADALARRYRIPRPAVVRNIPASTSGAAPQAAAAADRPLAVYVGGLMPGRGLESGIEALARVPGLRMELIGPGAESYRATLLALAERAGVAGRVRLRPAVAPDEVLAALRGASFGLMLIEPVCRSYELTLPNKLFEYAAAGVPMLAGDMPVIGPLVRRHRLGEAVPPADVEQVAVAMRRLLEPERNRDLRRRVAAFAAGNTWARERDALTAVYAAAMAAR